MLDHPTDYHGSFQQLADARRVLKALIPLRQLPVLPAEDRQELERIRALAIRTIEAATEELIETLDLLQGDADAEDATGEEDAFEDNNARFGYDGPGDPVSDPGGGNIEDEPHDWNELEVDEGASGI